MEKINDKNRKLDSTYFRKINDMNDEIIKSNLAFTIKQNLIIENLIKDLNNFVESVTLLFNENNNQNYPFSYISNNKIYTQPSIFINNINLLNPNININQSQNLFLSRKIFRNDINNHFSLNSNIMNENSKNDKLFFITKNDNKNNFESIINKNMKRKKKRNYVYRGSKYRGVTKSGKTWQVLIMINRNKKYFGNFKSEEEAAKVYDELAMKYHKDKARVNFAHKGFLQYTNEK